MVKRYEQYEAYAACVTDIKIEGGSSLYDIDSGRSGRVVEERKARKRSVIEMLSLWKKNLLYASGSYI